MSNDVKKNIDEIISN